MRKTLKRIVNLLCIFVLCLFVFVPGIAEDDTRKLDAERIRWAMAMTADLSGNALDQMDTAESGPVRERLSSFARIPYGTPDKAIVLEFTKDQTLSVKKALGVNGDWEDVAPALSVAINRQFREDYFQAANLARAEGNSSFEKWQYYTLIILPYGDHISVTSLKSSGNITSRTALIMSTVDISRNLGETDINQTIRQFGADQPIIRVYEKEDLDGLLAEYYWAKGSSPSNKLIDALLASEKRIDMMLPAFLTSDIPHLHVKVKYDAIVTLLWRMETADQPLLRNLSREVLPRLAVEADTEDPLEIYLTIAGSASKSKLPAPEMEYGEELHETDLKADGTFLVVFDKSYPEYVTQHKPYSRYEPILEICLPADHIPETVESADYIIRCSVTYEDGISNSSSTLHYPLTHVTVHDAHTGEMLRDLGSYKKTLKGAVMLSKGDTWWDPDYDRIWALISALF